MRRYVGKQSYAVETIGVADDFSDGDGIAVLNFKQAQDAARSLHVQRAHAAAGLPGPVTVAAALEAHIEFLECNGKKVSDQRYHARAFINPMLGEVEVAALKAKQLQEWLHDLTKLPPRVRTKAGKPQQHRPLDDSEDAIRRRRSSANRIFTTLRAALNYVWREKRVVSDGEWRRVEPFKKVDSARVRYLTVTEAQRLINASDPEFRPLLRAALETGCRYGELTRLEVQDFDPDAGTVAVRQTKSGKSRHVVLTDEGQAFFRQLAAGRNSEELLLGRADGSAWGKGHQNAFMAAACGRAKIKPISFHGFRHTWASLAVMAGVPLMIVARNLGHVDTKMVEKHYGHLGQSYITEAIRKNAPRYGFESSSVTPLSKRGG